VFWTGGASRPRGFTSVHGVGLAFNGAGQWSLDNAIGLNDAGLWWGLGASALAILGGLGAIAGGRSELPHRTRGAAAH
jgi:hypothetical protein